MDILGGCGDGGVLLSIVFGFSLSMFSDLLGLRPKFGVQARYCGVVVWTATILEVGSVDGFGGVGGDILPYGCIRLLSCPEKLASVDTMSFGEERDRDVVVFWSPSVKWVGSVEGF
ncbi:hypothetical protein M0R45_002190 [Rubus argutus]|uniref:Uncharacterized protein n=1 Tax=Rubus argutus TaxID=59490 RepID=A0AAW1VNA5_RUBAR